MAITMLVIPIVLFLIMAIIPIFELIGLILGLDFVIYNEPAVVITQAVLVFATMIAFLIINPELKRSARIFLIWLLPVSLLNALSFAGGQWGLSFIFAIVWSVCALILYLKFVPDGVFKAISAVCSVLISVVFVILFLIYSVFQPLTVDKTVTETQSSPNGEFIAEEIAVDGVFSDKMQLTVRRSEPVAKAVLGRYEEKAIVIYEGEAHETEVSKFSWKDDSVIIINDNEYGVSFDK